MLIASGMKGDMLMCTAIAYKTQDFYFGRTLDYEMSFGEEIAIVPQNYTLHFRHMGPVKKHYAIIGMAHVPQAYPLYYDAVNERGLGMAGLNFTGNAAYNDVLPDRDNIAQFELIPWLLCQCESVAQARLLLQKINLTATPYSEKLPAAQLHWLLSDAHESIVIESMADGLHLYDNPVGVLTNNPPFAQQLFGLNNYMHLSPRQPQNAFSSALALHAYSRGMGALGLPGDFSSASRFVRAAFVRMNARAESTEAQSVSQFFHILGAVSQPRGCCEVENGQQEFTRYTCCCNATRGVYYYTAYDNHQITAVDMHRENLSGCALLRYPLLEKGGVLYQN